MKPPRHSKQPRTVAAPRTTLRGPRVEINLLPTFKAPPAPAVATSASILTQICQSQGPMPFAAVVRNTRLSPQEAASAIDYLAGLGILVRIDEQDAYDLEPGTRVLKAQLTGGLSEEGVLALQETIRASLAIPLDKIAR